MRRKDPSPVHAGRGKSLISTRINQQQQRNMPNVRSHLPRSYSSPSTQNDPDASQSSKKGYVMRSFSTPEPKQLDYRRNSGSFYRPRSHGSRSELDSDLENFEQFEEGFLDIDTDQDVMYGSYRVTPEREEPKRVVTSLLQGSGLQRVSMRPLSSATTHTLKNAQEAMKHMQKSDRGNYEYVSYKLDSISVCKFKNKAVVSCTRLLNLDFVTCLQDCVD